MIIYYISRTYRFCFYLLIFYFLEKAYKNRLFILIILKIFINTGIHFYLLVLNINNTRNNNILKIEL